MPGLDILRTSTFRLTCLAGGVFALSVLMLFGFVYWRAAIYETARIDRTLESNLGSIVRGDPDAAVARLAQSAASGGDAHFGLFDGEGRPLAGNIGRPPPDLALDGSARRIDVGPSRGNAGGPMRAAGERLPDGRLLVLARDVTQIEEFQATLTRALEIGLLPVLGLSLLAGALLGWRAVRRVRRVRRTIERIMGGQIDDRLALTGAGDEFDQLAQIVNRMLDEICRLLDEIKGVGDDIAHDLRTPLTRVRTRLDRARQDETTPDAMLAAIDAAITGLDQALGIITALLRIAEIEDGRRRAAFGDVDLGAVARDIAELYDPVADRKGVTLTVEAALRLPVLGDRDLLIEAVANVIDNAIKFTPQGGRIAVAAFERQGLRVVRVADSGPGIPVEERQAVLKRFYRSDKSRHHAGSGLGLGLVQAIATLHGFRIEIGDAGPGCVFDILCPPPRAPALTGADRPAGPETPHAEQAAGRGSAP